MLIVDTGVLLAAADDSDPDHEACVRLLETEGGPLITTALVAAEAGYLIDRQLGPSAEAAFYRSVAAGDLSVEPLGSDDWRRIAEFIDRYAVETVQSAQRISSDTISAASSPPHRHDTTSAIRA